MEQSTFLELGERMVHIGLEAHQDEPQQSLYKCKFLQGVYTGHHAKRAWCLFFSLYFNSDGIFISTFYINELRLPLYFNVSPALDPTFYKKLKSVGKN